MLISGKLGSADNFFILKFLFNIFLDEFYQSRLVLLYLNIEEVMRNSVPLFYSKEVKPNFDDFYQMWTCSFIFEYRRGYEEIRSAFLLQRGQAPFLNLIYVHFGTKRTSLDTFSESEKLAILVVNVHYQYTKEEHNHSVENGKLRIFVVYFHFPFIEKNQVKFFCNQFSFALLYYNFMIMSLFSTRF